ncbi:MAG: transcription antitermination factor NusB [Acidobacteriota bacterium]
MSRGKRLPRRLEARASRSAHNNVRDAACFVVARTLASKAPVDTFMRGAFDRCDPRDYGLLRELVLGTLRWLRRLDDVLVQASGRPLDKIQDELLAPLRLGIYQLLFLRLPSHAVVNESVELARQMTHKGGASFTNAVLRKVAKRRGLDEWPVKEKDAVRRAAIEWSHPDLLVKRWNYRFGLERTIELMRANNERKDFHLLAFRHLGGRERLAEDLIDEGFEVEPSLIAPLGLRVSGGNPLDSEAFRAGRFYIQDEASQAAALIPPPTGDERILDLAAAPGGKTLSLLSYCPDLEVHAADVSLPRLARMRDNLDRLRLGVQLVCTDIASSAFGPGFDRVLVDLPCSGTGTLRKNPEIKWRLSDDELDRLGSQARTLSAKAADHVAPGGLLVLVSCSIEPEEVDRPLSEIERARDDFSAVDLAPLLPPHLRPQLVSAGLWQLLPGEQHDGFTVGVLRRRGGSR